MLISVLTQTLREGDLACQTPTGQRPSPQGRVEVEVEHCTCMKLHWVSVLVCIQNSTLLAVSVVYTMHSEGV